MSTLLSKVRSNLSTAPTSISRLDLETLGEIVLFVFAGSVMWLSFAQL